MFGVSKYPKGLELLVADPVKFNGSLVLSGRTAVKDVKIILSAGGGDGVVPTVEADCSREVNPELDELEESSANSRGGDSGPSSRLLTLGEGPSTVSEAGREGPRKKDATA